MRSGETLHGRCLAMLSIVNESWWPNPASTVTFEGTLITLPSPYTSSGGREVRVSEAMEFDYVNAVREARSEFLTKLQTYGPSWRVQRLTSLLDRVFAKVSRIRKLETVGGTGRVDESRQSEFLGVFNYCVMILDKTSNDAGSTSDGFEVPERWSDSEVASLTYDRLVAPVMRLFEDKNHDYDQAWRKMRPETFTDELMVRLQRIHFLEDAGAIQEDDAAGTLREQVLDMMNYAIFGWVSSGTAIETQ